MGEESARVPMNGAHVRRPGYHRRTGKVRPSPGTGYTRLLPGPLAAVCANLVVLAGGSLRAGDKLTVLSGDSLWLP